MDWVEQLAGDLVCVEFEDKRGRPKEIVWLWYQIDAGYNRRIVGEGERRERGRLKLGREIYLFHIQILFYYEAKAPLYRVSKDSILSCKYLIKTIK